MADVQSQQQVYVCMSTVTLLMLNYQKSPTFIYITVTIKTEKMYDVIFDFVAGL